MLSVAAGRPVIACTVGDGREVWVDITADIEIGEDERHLSGHNPKEGPYRAFIWNSVPVGMRVRKVVHHHVEGDEIVTGACFGRGALS